MLPRLHRNFPQGPSHPAPGTVGACVLEHDEPMWIDEVGGWKCQVSGRTVYKCHSRGVVKAAAVQGQVIAPAGGVVFAFL